MQQNNTDSRKYILKITVASIAFTILYIILTSYLITEFFDTNIKNFHIGDIYPYFLGFSLTMLVFASLLTYRAFKYGYSSLYILITSIFFVAIAYLWGFFNWDPTGSNYRETSFFQLQVLFTTISIFLLYLHYELNARDRPGTVGLFLITFLLTPHSIVNIYYLYSKHYSIEFSGLEFFTLVLLQIGTTIIFFLILRSGYRLTKSMARFDDKARLLGGIQLSGLILLFLGVILELVETIFPIDIKHTPFFIISFLLLGIPFYINPKIFASIPINIFLLAIIDNGGRTLYYLPIDEEFSSENAIEGAEQLFGGLTMAFTSMSVELAKSAEGIDSLKFGDRSIILEYKEPYYLVLIAENSTYFLQREMREYLEDLIAIYPKTQQAEFNNKILASINEKFYPLLPMKID